jgi:uncharacterized membrane protein YedE/YeeE
VDIIEAHVALPVVGVAAGIVLGFVARLNRFCTLSALERDWYAGDATGLRTWVLAATVAMLATQGLAATGLADIRDSFYLRSYLGLTGAVFGGLMFGFGMAMVGTCAFGAVIRLGGGSLRSLVVLLTLGLAAISTQRGLMGQVRVALVDNLALDMTAAGGQSIPGLISRLLEVDATLAVVVLLGGGLLAWIFADPAFRRRWASIGTGTAVGLVIAFGWAATTYFSTISFEPVQIEAGSFSVPVGDVIMHVITYTGTVPDYGTGLVVGAVIGAGLAAWYRNDARWEACDDARELSRHLAGGALMGIGGVFAMGCTIGQGVTGFSTLAISSPIAFASILLGARLGLSWMVEGSVWSMFRGRQSGHGPAE